jgi:type IV fimbrial biogenesis protein FimT
MAGSQSIKKTKSMPYKGRNKPLGFTIIELMVVIAIATVLMMMAVPSYQNFIKRNNVESLQSRFAAAVVTARSEASSRNGITTLCASSDGKTCGNNWKTGWIVFLDNGEGTGSIAKNANREANESLILSYTNTGQYKAALVNENGTSILAISFNSQGFSLNEKRALATLCEPEGNLIYARGLIIERSGRTMITRDLQGEDGIHESRFDDGFGKVVVQDLSC